MNAEYKKLKPYDKIKKGDLVMIEGKLRLVKDFFGFKVKCFSPYEFYRKVN